MKLIDKLENHFEFTINRTLRVGAGFDTSNGVFSVRVPAYTLSKGNISQRCVFTLKSFTIGNLDKSNAGSLVLIKEPSLILEIEGLGFKPNHFSLFYENQGFVNELQNNSKIVIPNILAGLVRSNNVVPAGQGNSVIGSDNLNEERLCSNPFGTELRFRLKRHDNNNPTFTSGSEFCIKFSLDFIDESC